MVSTFLLRYQEALKEKARIVSSSEAQLNLLASAAQMAQVETVTEITGEGPRKDDPKRRFHSVVPRS